MFEPLQGNQARGRSVWVTAVSFGLQTAAIGLLVLLPLIYTSAIPILRVGEPPTLPYSSPHQHMVRIIATHVEHHPAPATSSIEQLVEPGRIPDSVDRSSAPALPAGPADPDDGLNLPPGISGDDHSLSRAVVSAIGRPAAALPSKPRIVQVSVIELGSLIHKVQPVYPVPARIIHLQGEVVLRAIINSRGEVAEIETISGHPLLAAAARDAVRQWRYQPYRLNGEPVPVETQITVHFTIAP